MTSSFADRLTAAIATRGTPAIVGIDPVLERLPAELRPTHGQAADAIAAIETFSRAVIDAVAPIVPAVKINSAFFEAYYELGVAAYYRLVARAHARDLLVIGDVKRGDIGSTAELYARGHLDTPRFDDIDSDRIPDAVTLSGYLGAGSVAPFIEAARRARTGVYILVRPSDPGADAVHEFGTGPRFYEHMAALVSAWGAAPELRGACGLSCVGAVVAPRDPASTAALRAAMPHTPFLVPGFGAQGATGENCRPCFLAGGRGAVVNASRSVIYSFNDAPYVERCGSDWRACIAAAAQDFAAEMARVATG